MNVIRVELDSTGLDTCTAANITAHSHTPVLTLCRKMIAAGVDPATELQVFRGDTLALTIRNIGEAASLPLSRPEFRAAARPAVAPILVPGGVAGRLPLGRELLRSARRRGAV